MHNCTVPCRQSKGLIVRGFDNVVLTLTLTLMLGLSIVRTRYLTVGLSNPRIIGLLPNCTTINNISCYITHFQFISLCHLFILMGNYWHICISFLHCNCGLTDNLKHFHWREQHLIEELGSKFSLVYCTCTWQTQIWQTGSEVSLTQHAKLSSLVAGQAVIGAEDLCLADSAVGLQHAKNYKV